MNRKRRTYSVEEKQQIIEYYYSIPDGQRSYIKVAKHFSISNVTLQNWIKKANDLKVSRSTRTRYSFEFKLKIVKLLLSNKKSQTEIINKFGLNQPILSIWLGKYKNYGKNGLKRQKAKQLTSIDLELVLKILNHTRNHTYIETSTKFSISIPTIKKWELLYNSKGLKGLLAGLNKAMLKTHKLNYDKLIPMSAKVKKSKPKKHTKTNKAKDILLTNTTLVTNISTNNCSNFSKEKLLELELAKAKQIIKEQNKALKSKDKVIYKERVINEALKKLSTLLGVK